MGKRRRGLGEDLFLRVMITGSKVVSFVILNFKEVMLLSYISILVELFYYYYCYDTLLIQFLFFFFFFHLQKYVENKTIFKSRRLSSITWRFSRSNTMCLHLYKYGADMNTRIHKGIESPGGDTRVLLMTIIVNKG